MELPYYTIREEELPCGCMWIHWELDWYDIHEEGTMLEKDDDCPYHYDYEDKYPTSIYPRIEDVYYSDGAHETETITLYDKNGNEVIQLFYSHGELTGGRIGGIFVKAEKVEGVWRQLVEIFEKATEPDLNDSPIKEKTAKFRIVK